VVLGLQGEPAPGAPAPQAAPAAALDRTVLPIPEPTHPPTTEFVKRVEGLVHVTEYLDATRGKV
jgi:hypothetical protein